jgi:hypothetical protein
MSPEAATAHHGSVESEQETIKQCCRTKLVVAMRFTCTVGRQVYKVSYPKESLPPPQWRVMVKLDGGKEIFRAYYLS